MRVMAGGANRGPEGLVLVRLLQIRIFGIVAVEAERRGRFGQMEIVLLSRVGAGFVGNVASLTTHVESGVTAALGRNIEPLVMASQAEIVVKPYRRGRAELHIEAALDTGC